MTHLDEPSLARGGVLGSPDVVVHAAAGASAVGAVLAAEARELGGLVRAPVLGDRLGTQERLEAGGHLSAARGGAAVTGSKVVG
jgi:hypothetical protein